MFLTCFAAFAIAMSFFQLGALSIWVTVLSLALKLVLLLALVLALYIGLPLLWRRYKG
jgi:hypothetical protein